jgi:beta propeller repeat protein
MEKIGEREMQNKSRLHSAALASVAAVLFLILISSTASAAITETRITTNKSSSENPAIYNNKIVWQDDRTGNLDIYILDLSTKSQIHTTNLSDQLNPDIYGNNVVWEDHRNGNSDIYLQNLTTKKQTRITTNDFWDSLPAIYGNKIVWERVTGSSGASNIYMYDISNKK